MDGSLIKIYRYNFLIILIPVCLQISIKSFIYRFNLNKIINIFSKTQRNYILLSIFQSKTNSKKYSSIIIYEAPKIKNTLQFESPRLFPQHSISRKSSARHNVNDIFFPFSLRTESSRLSHDKSSGNLYPNPRCEVVFIKSAGGIKGSKQISNVISQM